MDGGDRRCVISVAVSHVLFFAASPLTTTGTCRRRGSRRAIHVESVEVRAGVRSFFSAFDSFSLDNDSKGAEVGRSTFGKAFSRLGIFENTLMLFGTGNVPIPEKSSSEKRSHPYAS